MKSTAVNRLLAMLLVTALTFFGAIPINAKGSGNKSSFAAKDGSGHTVYWSYGITPPKLPEGAESGAFGVAFDPEGGWFDLDLGEKDRRDGAAAAANLLHWWLNLNSSSIDRYLKKVPGQPEDYAGKLGDPQGVKAYLTAPNTQAPADSPLFGWMDSKGGKDSFAPDAYMDSFILGYPMNKRQNTPDDFHPEKEDGGFFFPVFDMITLTQQEKKLDNFQKTGKVIQSVLEERCGLILGVKDNKGNPGYLNLWGVEFDGDGAFTAVYVTDPANNAAGDDSLIRYSVFANDKKQIRMSDLGGKDEKGLVWDTLYILYAGADGFAGYLGDEYPDYGIPELDFGENDEQKPEDIPEDQKQWEPATYHWTEDHSHCQAVRTEKNTREIQPAEGTVTSQQTKAPTDTRAGVMTYTATFDADWAEEQVKNVPIPAIETEWGQVRYEWAEDHQTCWAVRKSKDDATIEQRLPSVSVTAQRTKEPTQTEKGETTYTAAFSQDWAASVSKTVADVPVLPAPVEVPDLYEWSNDNTACKAIHRNEDGTTAYADAAVTRENTKLPTCREEGVVTYTAAFNAPWAKTQVKTVNTPRLTPNWGEVTYEWSADHNRCTAKRVCRNEKDHVETAVADVSAYTNNGKTVYKADFKENWAVNQEKTVKAELTEEDWKTPTYKWSADNKSCTASRISKDGSLVQNATAKVTSSVTKKPTDTQRGETTYNAAFKEGWAKDQRKTVADIPPLKGGNAEDGQWNAPTYEWAMDYSRCTASRSKKNDPSNVTMAHGRVTVQEVRPATCQQPGESVYTASFKESWAKDQKVTVEVKTGKHTLEQVPEVPGSGSVAGVKAHYKCSLCGKLFSDPEGTLEVSLDSLTIQKPTMSGDNAIVEGIPEKDNTVALTEELLTAALKENRNAKGVLIQVGDTSVVYARATVEAFLKDNKNARKLVLQVKPTDAGNGGLTTDQAVSVDKNRIGTLYQVSLKNGKKDIEAPCTVMLPYTPASPEGITQVYRVAENGSFQKTNSQLANGYLAWNADTGFFLATETEPLVEKAKAKSGMIVWVVILVVSGLAFIGGGGFFLYKKFREQQEEDFKDGPQLDQAARERIKARPQTGTRPAAPVQPQSGPRPAPKVQQPAPVPGVAQSPAAPAQPTLDSAQVLDPGALAAEPEVPTPPAEPYQGAFAAPEPPAYQGAFEAPEAPAEPPQKPTLADKAVKAQSKAHTPKEYPPRSADELDALKHWLDQIDE